MRPVVMIVVSSADMKRDSQRLARSIPDVRRCRDMHIPDYNEAQPCAADVEFGYHTSFRASLVCHNVGAECRLRLAEPSRCISGMYVQARGDWTVRFVGFVKANRGHHHPSRYRIELDGSPTASILRIPYTYRSRCFE